MTRPVNINLWADLDGVAPKQAISDHPALSAPNPIITITLFKGATSRSRSLIAYEAPVYATPQMGTNILDALEALSDLQRAQSTQPYMSFGKWAGPHKAQHHYGQTALVLEYDVKNAMKVADILANEAGVAFWVIPTFTRNTNCYLFAIPLLTPIVTKGDPKRLASLIVEAVGQPGLTRDCYNPTYFFKMRSDSMIYFSDGQILDPHAAISRATGKITNLKKYER